MSLDHGELSSRHARINQLEEAEAFLDAHCGSVGDDPLLWCFRPQLHTAFDPHRIRYPWGRVAEFAHRLARYRTAQVGMTYWVSGKLAVAVQSPTESRMVAGPLRSVGERLTHEARTAPPRRVDEWLRIARGAHAWATETARAARREGVWFNPVMLEANALMAVSSYVEAGYVLGDEVDVLVVANQHSVRERAAIRRAHERGITTVHLPHAPVVARRQYGDLPTDHAGLWGPREVDWFTDLGASRSRLAVVGDSAHSDVGLPPIDPSLPPVLALSNDPVATNLEIIRFVRHAISGPVTLAVHPSAGRRRLARAMPSDWRLAARAETYRELMQGPPVVIQHSSGVAMEALGLGLPTIELVFPGEQPTYPLIHEPYVAFVSTIDGLIEAIGRAKAAHNALARAELAGWASEWRSVRGDAAIAKAAELIESAGSRPKPEHPILDSWAT